MEPRQLDFFEEGFSFPSRFSETYYKSIPDMTKKDAKRIMKSTIVKLKKDLHTKINGIHANETRIRGLLGYCHHYNIGKYSLFKYQEAERRRIDKHIKYVITIDTYEDYPEERQLTEKVICLVHEIAHAYYDDGSLLRIGVFPKSQMCEDYINYKALEFFRNNRVFSLRLYIDSREGMPI